MPTPTSYSETNLVRGNTLFLYFNNQVLAFAKSLDLQINKETINVSSKFSGDWTANISGTSSYTISSDFLYTKVSGAMSFDTLKGLSDANTPVPFKIGLSANKTDYAMSTGWYSGTAYIKSLSLKASDNQVIECSIQLDGCGPLDTVVAV